MECINFIQLLFELVSKMQSNMLHLSSVIQTSSPWKVKSSSSYLSKIAKMENLSSAIILKQDSNKPLRFLYLYLFMNKKNAAFMQNIIAKIAQIKYHRDNLSFSNLPHSVASLLPTKVQALHELLQEIHNKLENHSYTYTAILKLSHQFALIDPLLIACLRLIIEDCQLSSTALDWNANLNLNQIQILLQRLTNQKITMSTRNRFILFHHLSEVQYQFFKSRKVPVVNQNECFDQISDNQTIRYQEYLMIQKTFSLL